MTQLGTELHLRPAVGTDLNFIFDTFRESVRHDSSLGRSCRTSIFKKEFARVIDHVLEKSKVLIACMSSDHNVILGYLIYEAPAVLQYIFVKQAFRRMGIAKELCHEALGDPGPQEVQCAFKTQSARELFDRFPILIHNPFINFKQGASNGQSSS
jgi:ribosomal protein S18 acetylase RimI-like enzyme